MLVKTLQKPLKSKKAVTIKRVAADLENANIVKPAWQFQVLAKIKKQENKIKAGEFSIEPGMTAEAVLDRFVAGKTLSYNSKIVEGYTFSTLVKNIKKDPNLVQTLTDADYADIMNKLGSPHKKPEGWFFPDTYNYPRGTTDLEFLKRSHKAMQDFLTAEWDKRDKESPTKKAL